MENVRFENVDTVRGTVFRDQLITLGDLATFKAELLSEIKLLLKENTAPAPRKWLKSYEVKQLLNLSSGTLQTLRSNGTLPYTRVGGAIYYDYEDIQKVLSTKKCNGISNGLQRTITKNR